MLGGLVSDRPDFLRIMSGVCGALSILGSGLLILSFVAFSCNQWRSATAKSGIEDKARALIGGYLLQVCFLAVADLLVGCAWMLSLFLTDKTEPTDTLCVVQAWLVALTPLISAAWTACICHELLCFAVRIHKEVTGTFVRRRYAFYHLSWVLPAALVLPMLAGPSRPMFTGSMCWLDDGQTGLQPFYWLYVPKLVVMLFVLGVYARVSSHMCATDPAVEGGGAASSTGRSYQAVRRPGFCHRMCLRACCCYHCCFSPSGAARTTLRGRHRSGCSAGASKARNAERKRSEEHALRRWLSR